MSLRAHARLDACFVTKGAHNANCEITPTQPSPNIFQYDHRKYSPPLDVIWFAKAACDLRPVLAPDCCVHGLALALDKRLLTANTGHDGVGHQIHF